MSIKTIEMKDKDQYSFPLCLLHLHCERVDEKESSAYSTNEMSATVKLKKEVAKEFELSY